MLIDDENKTIIALFTYGGGMRGIVPARIMARIEERTGLRMADMVDIFTGPSTGAILNAAMTRRHPAHLERPLYRARHLVKFYEHHGLKIFPQDSFRSFRGMVHDFNNRTLKIDQLNNLFRYGHYDPKNLSVPLKKLYGDAKLGDSLSSLIIPTYNIDGGQLQVVEEPGETGDAPAHTRNNVTDGGGHAVWLKHIRNNYPDGALRRTPDVMLHDAVMASCAAPTYYPCHHFNAKYADQRGEVSYTGIDGVIFDNPCISYLGAIRRHVPPGYKLVLLVLGTGYTNRSFKKEDWNRYGALGVVDPVNDLPLINIFFHASESALMDTFEEEMGDNLFIFNKNMITDIDHPESPNTQIDDASPENLKRLRHFSEELMEESASQLDAICHLLATRRDRRQGQNTTKTTHPTMADRARKYYYSFKGNRKGEGPDKD